MTPCVTAKVKGKVTKELAKWFLRLVAEIRGFIPVPLEKRAVLVYTPEACLRWSARDDAQVGRPFPL